MSDNLWQRFAILRNDMNSGEISRSSPEFIARLAEIGRGVEDEEVEQYISFISQVMSPSSLLRVPPFLTPVLRSLLENRVVDTVLDPWAGVGELLHYICQIANPRNVTAVTRIREEAVLGEALVPSASWKLGDPLDLINADDDMRLDLVASILPFGSSWRGIISLLGSDGQEVRVRGDLGALILAGATNRLVPNGIGIFVVPSSLVFLESSPLHRFHEAGLGLAAAFELPVSTFAPLRVSSYLLVMLRRNVDRVFTGQLTLDTRSNQQLISNFLSRREGATLQLGRYADAQSFRGLGPVRLADRIRDLEKTTGVRAVALEDMATSLVLGRHLPGFSFPDVPNAVLIPLLGRGNVIPPGSEPKIKLQNYAQVGIDPDRSDARFVAQFLNSSTGLELREMSMSGATIPRLNRGGVAKLPVVVPSVAAQNRILEVETEIAQQRNRILELEGEIDELERQLWASPKSIGRVSGPLRSLSTRLAIAVAERTTERLDDWCETLPFPLASVIRAWYATSSDDYRARSTLLLDFFEAAVEFISIILLSAFRSSEFVFEEHRAGIATALSSQNVSLERSTFGTWKVLLEYLAKQTRELLNGGRDQRQLCTELFADPTLALPEVLASKSLVELVARTNQLRNNWKGHGGALGQEEARLRNEQLLQELQQFRSVMEDVWQSFELVRALHCRPRRGLFETEVAHLTGSNSEFVKSSVRLATPLDVERLYLLGRGQERPLLLVPLVQIGPSPDTAKNACYFFNRIDKDGARFISYHYADQPELRAPFVEATTTVRSLVALEAAT